MSNEIRYSTECFLQETLFKKILHFFYKPFKYRFLVLSFLFIFTTYFFIGFGLVSNPSLTLFYSKSAGLKTEAIFFLQIQGINCTDSPNVYVLTKDVRKLFYWPYVFAFGLTVDAIRYSEQIHQSYSMIENSAVVMQEEEVYDRWVFAHEVGHIAHFCINPDGFDKQTTEQKEKFAENFREAIQTKLQSKTYTFK